MKKNIYSLAAALMAIIGAKSQHTVTFESFTLAPNSYYSDTTSKPFQDVATRFQHLQFKIANTWYWMGGFSYTNKYDSSTAGFTNLYGVKPYWGYNNSAKYCVGQMYARLALKPPYKQLDGFYITNTTYAYKSMKYGDAFAKKFGGPTGNDPDFFKITVRGYLNGNMKTDSVEFYLADYRFTNNAQDYIINTWQWVNTTSLGQVDSVEFHMFSSDNSQFGMNTPAYFGLDNVTVSNPTGLNEIDEISNPVLIYPSPASDKIFIKAEKNTCFKITDSYGRVLLEEINYPDKPIDISDLPNGIYFIQTKNKAGITLKQKFIINNR
ncbi:MAG: DUF4465 domain-containing protein [Bacteroidia bacterium]|nr:DUF4465 domain-containing protein [Bacteroidia bacterium]